MKKLSVRLITEGAVMVAFSFVLSFVKLFSLPQGGSVTLVSMLPLIVFALRRGPLVGIPACVVYGVLQFFQDGYALTPAAIAMDYVFAFGVIGIAGFFVFKDIKISAVAAVGIACVARFVFHFLSGIIFYASYAPEGTPVWLYSLVYNGSFMGVELAFTAIVAFFMALRAPSLLKRQN